MEKGIQELIRFYRIIPCVNLGWTLKGSTRVIARYAVTILFIEDPIYIIPYSNEWKGVDTFRGSMCNHFFDLYLYVLTREILYSSCVFYFNGNRNELINLRSQFYVKITSVCVTDSFLVRYVRNMTYHENKKIRYIAVEIISGFFFPATSKKLWLCFQCGKRYMWKDSLKKHLRVECGKEPTYECPICGRKFKHKHRWQSHARLIHYLDIWPTKQARV